MTPDAVLARLARSRPRSWWVNVLIGLGFAAGGLFVRWSGQAFYGEVTGFIILLPAVILAALTGGRTAGVVATIACLLGGWVVAGSTAVGFGVANAMGRVATVNFILVGLFSTLVAASLRKTVRQLDRTIAALGGSDEALLKSESRFRTAVAATRGILWTNSAEGRMEGDQPGWAALTGQTREQYRGYGWSAAVHPEDAQASVDAWNVAVAKREPFDFQHRVRIADGTYRTFDIRAVPTLDRDGRILEWVGVHTDVTEAREAEVALRESEARFRLMADTAPSPVWLTDAAGDVEFVNKALETFYGKPGETFLGQAWKASVHPDDIAGVAATQAEARENFSPYGFECRFQRHDGVWRWMRVSVNPRFDGEGVFQGYVGMSFDVTETRVALEALAAQERRQRLLLELADGVRELEDPSAIMDHVQSVLGRLLGASRVGYGEFSLDRQTVELMPDWTEGVPSLAGIMPVPDLGEQIMAELFLGLTVAVDDVTSDARTIDAVASLARREIGGFVTAPLFRAGEMRAFLFVHSAPARAWTAEDVALIQDVADRTWSEVERARAEAELRESEARFRDIADTAPVLIWVTAQDRTRAFVNQTYVDYNGGTYEEARLADWRAVIHPDDQDRILAESLAGEATGKPFSLEARYLRQDGVYRWLKSFSRPRLGAGGQVLGFVGVAFDVTDIRESNLRLSTAMAERDAILSQLAEGVIVTDPDGAIIFVNEAARRHHGVARLDVSPDDYADAYQLFTEDGRPYPPDQLPLTRAVRNGTTITDARWRIRRPDGSEVIAVGNARPVVTETGASIGAVLTLRDDTARVEAEQRLAESEGRFRTVADSAPVPIWMSDADGNVVFANLAYRSFFKVLDKPLKGGWTGMMTPEDRVAFEADYRRAFDRREPYDGAVRVIHPDLGVRWLRSQGVPRFDAAGQFQGYVGVNLDVTEAQQAEQDLKRINELLEDRVGEALAEKAKAEADLMHAQRMEAVGRLTGGVAHDFNNLLTVVIGALDMILRSPDDGARRQKMGEAALAAARRGERLTHQLLAFSRRQTLRPEAVDLNALIRQSDPLLRRAVGEALDYRLKLRRGGARVIVDPAQFEAAMLNLIVNARDAIAEKGAGDGGAIAVQTRHCRIEAGEVADVEPGDYVCVSVADTGAGMDEETMRRVFEPFFTTKAVGKGTGLGLSQVYGFARQSGGGVRLDSTPGQGTTIDIYLPPAAAVADAEKEPTAAATGPTTGSLLLVEDDPGVAAVAFDLLTEHGLSVTLAENGPEALARLETATFDIMLTDVVMPGGMSGIELARRAADLYPAMRILLASGYAGDDVDDDLVGASWPLLRKPYSGEELFQALGRAKAAQQETAA
jgi:PAS domain S-box-containing protein